VFVSAPSPQQSFSALNQDAESRDREGAIATTRGACAPQTLGGEFLFDQPIQMISDRRMIKALDHFIQKSGDDETLRD